VGHNAAFDLGFLAPALFGDYQVSDDGAWVPGWRKV